MKDQFEDGVFVGMIIMIATVAAILYWDYYTSNVDRRVLLTEENQDILLRRVTKLEKLQPKEETET